MKLLNQTYLPPIQHLMCLAVGLFVLGMFGPTESYAGRKAQLMCQADVRIAFLEDQFACIAGDPLDPQLPIGITPGPAGDIVDAVGILQCTVNNNFTELENTQACGCLGGTSGVVDEYGVQCAACCAEEWQRCHEETAVPTNDIDAMFACKDQYNLCVEKCEIYLNVDLGLQVEVTRRSNSPAYNFFRALGII